MKRDLGLKTMVILAGVCLRGAAEGLEGQYFAVEDKRKVLVIDRYNRIVVANVSPPDSGIMIFKYALVRDPSDGAYAGPVLLETHVLASQITTTERQNVYGIPQIRLYGDNSPGFLNVWVGTPGNFTKTRYQKSNEEFPTLTVSANSLMQAGSPNNGASQNQTLNALVEEIVQIVQGKATAAARPTQNGSAYQTPGQPYVPAAPNRSYLPKSGSSRGGSWCRTCYSRRRKTNYSGTLGEGVVGGGSSGTGAAYSPFIGGKR